MATGGGFIRSIDKGCDEFYDYCCASCSAEGKNVEAVYFCTECDEYFCQACAQLHHRFGKMKMHQILEETSMKARGPQQVQSIPTVRCTQHHANLLDTYCGKHDDVCCGTCVTLDHRSCTMTYIATAANGVKKSKEYKDIKSSMKNIQIQLEKMKKERQDELKKLEQEKNNVLTQIKDFRKALVKRLDELEKTTTDELQAKHQAFQDKINADINRLEAMLTSMQANRKKLKKSPGDNESELFVYLKTGKKTETDGKKLIGEIEKHLKKCSLKLIINLNIEGCLKSQKSLGDFQDDERLYSASLHGGYNVKVTNDNMTCDINGSCELKDRTILVADFNNKKLKRLDRSYQVRDHCDLPRAPYAVCATGPQEVAVTLHNEKKVQFVSVRYKMTLTRSFNVKCTYCRGVAYTNDQLFVSCTPASVHVYNRSGTLLNTIQQDSTGQVMFSWPQHIALSNDCTKLHIADRDNGVITLGIHGDKQSQFTDPELKYASGVCVGNNDEIFVCGYNSHNILQISRDGGKLGVLLGVKDGINNPQSLCWDRDNSRLIVTMLDTDNIKVFNMKKKY